MNTERNLTEQEVLRLECLAVARKGAQRLSEEQMRVHAAEVSFRALQRLLNEKRGICPFDYGDYK